MLTYTSINDEQLNLEADKCVVHFIKGAIIARKRREISQKKLASMSGITPAYMTQIEKSIDPNRATKEISSQLMFKIASSLQCSVDMLILYGRHYDYSMNFLNSK